MAFKRKYINLFRICSCLIFLEIGCCNCSYLYSIGENKKTDELITKINIQPNKSKMEEILPELELYNKTFNNQKEKKIFNILMNIDQNIKIGVENRRNMRRVERRNSEREERSSKGSGNQLVIFIVLFIVVIVVIILLGVCLFNIRGFIRLLHRIYRFCCCMGDGSSRVVESINEEEKAVTGERYEKDVESECMSEREGFGVPLSTCANLREVDLFQREREERSSPLVDTMQIRKSFLKPTYSGFPKRYSSMSSISPLPNQTNILDIQHDDLHLHNSNPNLNHPHKTPTTRIYDVHGKPPIIGTPFIEQKSSFASAGTSSPKRLSISPTHSIISSSKQEIVGGGVKLTIRRKSLRVRNEFGINLLDIHHNPRTCSPTLKENN